MVSEQPATIVVKCKKCWGSGKLHYEEFGTFICDDCKGTGKVEITDIEGFKEYKPDYGPSYRPY